MKTMTVLGAGLLCALLVAMPVGAQPPAASDPHHPDGESVATAPGAGATTMPMAMCRQMMGDAMGMPMMGGAMADPKQQAAMLQMRGEMMKAMGDIMMKHARRMQDATSP